MAWRRTSSKSGYSMGTGVWDFSARKLSHWPAKLRHQLLRPRILEHPPDLLFQNGVFVQLILAGQLQQLVVGDAAPQEERQARGQFQIGDAIDLAGGQIGRLGLAAEHKFGVRQDPAQRHLDPVVETAFIPSALVEAHQDFGVLIRQRPAERPAAQAVDDLARAGRFLAGAGGLAHENPAAGGGVAGSLGLIGAVDHELADVREEAVSGKPAGFDGAAQEVLVQVIPRRVIGRQEGDHHGVAPRLGREFEIERAVAAPSLAILIPVEQVQPLAVHQYFQLLARDFAERVGVPHVALADGGDLHVVLAVGRELVLHDHPAAGAEGHAFDVIILIGVFRHAVGGLDGGADVADRQAADFAGGGNVAFEQRRRNAQRARDVIEAARGIVGGQELARVDVDVQQIPNRVGVFGAVHAMQSGRRNMELGGVVEFVFREHDGRFEELRFRPRHARRRHHPGAKLANHLLPVFRILFDVRRIEAIQRDAQGGLDAASLGRLTVTAIAILSEKSLLGRGRGHRGGRRRLLGLARHPDYAQYDSRAAHQDFCSHDFV